MALFHLHIFLAVCATAKGITEPPSAITVVAAAACPLTNSIPACGVSLADLRSPAPIRQCQRLTTVSLRSHAWFLPAARRAAPIHLIWLVSAGRPRRSTPSPLRALRASAARSLRQA